jgi:hypothetical protein
VCGRIIINEDVIAFRPSPVYQGAGGNCLFLNILGQEITVAFLARAHGSARGGLAIGRTQPTIISGKIVRNHVQMPVALFVWDGINIFMVPGFPTMIMSIEYAFIVVPDDGAPSSRGERGCDNSAVCFEDP